MSEDGLIFAPLGWIYHDAWKYNETKTLIDHDTEGKPVYIDKTKTCVQKGHCHLFLPGIDTNKASSTKMYWGEQKYEFRIVDEWGPNSKFKERNKSIRLIGKPIWYFRIEEYWRRMYVQPWDIVDMTCELPHNQEYTYERRAYDGYLQELIHKNGLDETAEAPEDEIPGEDGTMRLGFDDYLELVRRRTARRLYIAEKKLTQYNEWYWEHYPYAPEPGEEEAEEHPTEAPMDDDSILEEFITSDDTIAAEFEEFYRLADKTILVDYVEAMEAFLSMHGVQYMPDHAKRDTEGYILIPVSKTGHTGIKWDASKPCHSLGPFMEGGEFYFFNTVVNRTMPCEYWLDEDMRIRQYYLKTKAEGVETSGGQTWTLGSDQLKFSWAFDTFADTRETLTQKYEPHGWSPEGTTSSILYVQHRFPIPYIPQTGDGYYCKGMNAKRIRTDKFKKISYGFQENPVWVGDNSKVVPGTYDEDAYAADVNSRDYTDPTHPKGTYDENGWHEAEPEPTPVWTESENAVHWDKYSWAGWYEQGEIVQCPFDRKWYRREWAPAFYSPDGTLYDDKDEHPDQPFWSRMKRQEFPNPSPWLCDNSANATDPAVILSNHPYPHKSHFSNQCQDGWTAADNRRHLLHFEYAVYYELNRKYHLESGNDDTSRDHVWVYVIPPEQSETGSWETKTFYNDIADDEQYAQYAPYFQKTYARTWEACLDDYKDENGHYPQSIAAENAIFDTWLSNVYQDELAKFADKYVYYDEDMNEIPENTIDIINGRYRIESMAPEDEDSKPTYKPLPSPIYVVCGYSSYVDHVVVDGVEKAVRRWSPSPFDPQSTGAMEMESDSLLTYVPFSEFCTIWRPLTDDEIRRYIFNGDMPTRNAVPYRTFTVEDDTIKDYFGSREAPGTGTVVEFDPANPGAFPFTDGEREFKLGSYGEEGQSAIGGIVGAINASAVSEPAKSAIQSEFFPRIDEETRAENARRQEAHLPALPLSPLDEGDQLVENGPFDPYRNGTVNPIETWKKYFTKREEYTIPASTYVGGDKGITSEKSTPNAPLPHPRETSYSHEDGARRMYPDDRFVSPIIEYQKVLRTNETDVGDGYCRLPAMISDERHLRERWKIDQTGNWGDGFDVSVSIPYKINGEIQSPFSNGNGAPTQPAGQYCHACVKPENMMRYHIEFYDSLEQIWKYDFPNYVNIIRAFQEDCPLYVENFDDHDATLAYRENTKADDIPEGYATWGDRLKAFWEELDATEHFSENPVVRNYDCHGNTNESTKGNVFVTLDDDSIMWREDTTGLLPTMEDVPLLIDEQSGTEKIGYYLDSEGKERKGGKVVEWNNPVQDKSDGKWVEQCLGAAVRAKVKLILEDALGYRWEQWVDATAMTSNQPLRGSDYDATI